MAGTALHLLVILLGFSHLVYLNAVPITRTKNIMSDSQVIVASGNTQQVSTEETWEEELINGRMDLEKNDYPGSGANHHHDPGQH